MSQELWTAVDSYLSELFVAADPILDETLKANADAGLPSIDVAPNQGKLLQMLAVILGAKRILEIGTLGGYSTIWLARGLPAGSRLISLEVNSRHAAVARSNVRRAGLSEVVEIRVGPAADALEQLSRESQPPFDFIFIDADKPNNPVYLSWAIKLARRGTIIVCDNVIREGEIVDVDSRDASVKGTRAMFEMLREDGRVTATAIQTVGCKGYDGFMLARVLSDGATEPTDKL